MSSVARLRRWLRDLPASHGTELRLCFRIATSAVLTLLVSQLLHLRFGLWAVLTAVILTQMSVGKSLKATTDYLVATIGGAIFAGAVGALVPHDSEAGLALVLALTLVPVALVAAENVRFAAAPFTAVIVLLAPTITHLGPIASAFERVIEVAVGCIVGLFVSFVVLPARAYDLSIGAAGHVLSLMAKAIPKLLGGLTRDIGEAALSRVGQTIGEAYESAEAMAVEGTHERMTYLTATSDLQPLLRTLLRLRHDFVMIARIAAVPLPTAIRARFAPVLDSVARAAASCLHASGTALVARQDLTPRQELDAAFDGYAGEIAALSREDGLRDLPIDVLKRILALAFALEELRRNLMDLERWITDRLHANASRAVACPARSAL